MTVVQLHWGGVPCSCRATYTSSIETYNILIEMASCSALGCVLLLFLVTHSYSLCVIKEGSTSCCDSSLILMSSSQLKRNNGSSLTIKDLPSVSSNSSDYNLTEVDVSMGTMSLEHNFTDSSNTTIMVRFSKGRFCMPSQTLTSKIYNVMHQAFVFQKTQRKLL